MRSKWFLILGICLILASIGFGLFFGIRGYLGEKECREIAAQLEAALPERTPGAGKDYILSDMPVWNLSGVDYVALLEVPAFGVTLPVADQWNADMLHISPCRFSGSAYDCTMVIGGTDSQGQFFFCDQIDQGAFCYLTDMTGRRFAYTVVRVDRGEHADAQWLTSGQYDLTLFCRDAYSMGYIAVRCNSAAG